MANDKPVIDGTLAEWMPILREMLSDYGQFGAMLLVDTERRAEPTAEHPIIAVEVDDTGSPYRAIPFQEIDPAAYKALGAAVEGSR